MPRQASRLMYALATVLAVAALAPAVGIAAVQVPLTTCHQYCDTVAGRHGTSTAITPPPQIVTVVAPSGFSWSDAAIGFGTACGLALVAFGAMAYRRHGAVHEIREPA